MGCPDGATLPELIRGAPLVFSISTDPAVPGLFAGKLITVHIDSPQTGERITIEEMAGTGTGTYEETGITHSTDESEVVVNLEDTEQLEETVPGLYYQITAVISSGSYIEETLGPWSLPVKELPGGAI